MRNKKYLLFFFLISVFTLEVYATNSEIVENCVEQINYLERLNKKNNQIGNASSNWYIYFLEGSLNDLKYIKNEVQGINAHYLNKLNEQLIEINKSKHTKVYVAFTGYEKVISTALFPKDMSRSQYVETFFKKSASVQKTENPELFEYASAYRKEMKEIYNKSFLSKDNQAKDIMMPFTMRSIRTVPFLESEFEGKIYWNFNVYHPRKSDLFDINEFNKWYAQLKGESVYGTAAIEIRMEALVQAIDKHLIQGEKSDLKDCFNLLQTQSYRELVAAWGKEDKWIQQIENDPCILDRMLKLQGDWIGETEFERELMLFVCAPLYAALALPAASVMGPEIMVYLAREKGKKALIDMSSAGIFNVIMQTTMIYYFDDEIAKITDKEERLQAAFKKINYLDLGKDVIVAALDLNIKYELVADCIVGGIDYESIDFDDFNSFKELEFNYKACLLKAIMTLGIKSAFKYLNHIYKGIKNKNPTSLLRGFRELRRDAETAGLAKASFFATVKEMKSQLSLTKEVSDWLNKSIEIEETIGDAVQQFAKEMQGASPPSFGKSSVSFQNLVKDAAIEIKTKAPNAKIGANITLDFKLSSGVVTIKPSLLVQEDTGYKLVFVINKETSVESMEQLMGFMTKNGKQVLQELKKGGTARIRGPNAEKFFGKSNQDIPIEGLEVYTRNANNLPTKNKKVNLANAEGSLLLKLDNPLFSALKGKVNQLDDVLKPQFLDDFADASDDVLKKLQDDNLFDVWKNDIRSNNITELTEYLSKGNLRNDYISAVESISNRVTELRNLGKTDLEIAQEVFELRRQTTIDFKNATPDDMLPWIFEFNDIRYTQKGLGDKWGLTWDGVVSKATKNGVTDYNRIIQGASTPLGDKQALGKALFDVVGDKTLPTLEKYRMTDLIP